MKKFRCVPLREELVLLTGDYKKAIILGQMIYWNERVRDVAHTIEEGHCDHADPIYGWFYKKAEHLAEETLMEMKPKAMRTHLKYLVEQGWLFERRNPHYKMDKTLQYRVNVSKVQEDLHQRGCVPTWSPLLTRDHRESQIAPSTLPKENTKDHNEVSKGEIDAPRVGNGASTRDKKDARRIVITSREGEKENDNVPKPLDMQGIDPSLKITSEITTKMKETEITEQQQPKEVVCVQELIWNLFEKKMPHRQVESLICFAEQERVDVRKMIRNTYTYHSAIEPCRNIFGAIKHAIELGGWDIGIQKQSKPVSSLPKAVREQLERDFTKQKEDEADPVFLEKKARLQRKLERMREDQRKLAMEWRCIQ